MRTFFLLPMLVTLAFIIANCNNDEPPVQQASKLLVYDEQPQLVQEENKSLVGEWYAVGSTDFNGAKVILTETNVTFMAYAKDQPNRIIYDNLVYGTPSDGTIRLVNPPISTYWIGDYIEGDHITEFIYAGDTLVISRFIPIHEAVGYPDNLRDIRLIKNNKISSQEHFLVGEWRGAGTTDSSSVAIIFTETNLYFGYYGNLDYNILSDGIILLGNFHAAGWYDDEGKYHEEDHITEFTYINDTLIIYRFIESAIAVPYPKNLRDIHLIKNNKTSIRSYRNER
jgi:hypothetical protein